MIQERFLMLAAVLVIANSAFSYPPPRKPAEEFTAVAAAAKLQNGAFKARLNNVEISYAVSGAGPVIFVQGVGWGPDSRLYQNTLKFLETNYTLVYVDPRGTGAAEPITDLAQLSSDLMADDLDALRQHLQLNKIILMGHAHGGLIAMKYALKFATRLSQLILVDCVLLANLEEDTRLINENLQRHPRRKDPAWETAMAKFKNEYDARTAEALRENLRATAILHFNSYNQSQRANFEKAVNEMKISLPHFEQFVRGDLLHYDVDEQESRLTTPTLLLYGLSDPYFIRASARRLHFSLRNSKLELFERSGHYPWLEEPQHFAEVVKIFLSAMPAPAISEKPKKASQR
jgi:pimeloyl-ACP methyl ester carboxylesterase